MKKVLLAVAVVAFLASCKKDYICTCVDTSTTPSTTTIESFPGLSKTQADLASIGCFGIDFEETCTWSED
jgi:hypothetical protein